MAETLTELVAKISTDAAGLKSGLSDAEKQTEVSSKKMADSLKQVGKAMAASGAIITAALGLMGRAAINEEINIKHLQVALKGVGANYDDVKNSLEAVISATQRKTGIADNEQRDTLARLILVTKDYDKALKLLPLALDLAAFSQMNTSSAATYLAKAYEELEAGADKIGIRMGTTTIYFKDLDEVQKMVGGTAEAMVNPFSVLTAAMSDLSEVIGSFLIPTIEKAVSYINAVSTGTQNWIKANSDLIAPLVLSTLKLGVLLTVIGSIILILPKIAGFITMITGLLGPWGWAVLAVAGFIGYLVAELLGLSKVMAGIKDIMADVEKQMFIMRAEQALSAEEWAEIKEQGYLTEQQFINLAKAMKLTTEELYTQMEASGMLQTTMALVGDTNVYLTETVKQNTIATEQQTKAVEKSIKVQKTALEELTEQLKKTRREYEYTRSDAGRLGVTLNDVTFALFNQGKTVDEIALKLVTLGDDANNVNMVMEAFGLTAKQVNEILKTNADDIDKLSKKYSVFSSLVKQAVTDIEGALSRIAGEVTYEQGTPVLSAAATVAASRYGVEIPTAEQIATVKEEAHQMGIPGYQHGGVVGNTGLAYLHEGETVIPTNEGIGGITINFTQPVFFDREDTMNRFVDMISKGIDRKQRLRFGGAYSG